MHTNFTQALLKGLQEAGIDTSGGSGSEAVDGYTIEEVDGLSGYVVVGQDFSFELVLKGKEEGWGVAPELTGPSR